MFFVAFWIDPRMRQFQLSILKTFKTFRSALTLANFWGWIHLAAFNTTDIILRVKITTHYNWMNCTWRKQHYFPEILTRLTGILQKRNVKFLKNSRTERSHARTATNKDRFARSSARSDTSLSGLPSLSAVTLERSRSHSPRARVSAVLLDVSVSEADV